MSLRYRTNNYWARRSAERLLQSERTTARYMRQIEKVYDDAQRKVLKELLELYAKCYDKEKGSFNKRLLGLIVSEKDNKSLMIKIEQLGLTDKVPAKYQGQISRLEHLQKMFWTEIKEASIKHNQIETTAHKQVFEENYYRVAYDISKGIGSTPVSFSALDTQTINQVVSTRFEGKNYSQRIWGNTNILANQLKSKLAVAVATGQSVEKTSREFRDRFGVQKYYAKRLIRTESNFFHNASEIEAYKKMGFDRFTFLATLDNRTSEVCAHTDGKTFKITDAVAGYNVPPLHPNCRSTIIPALKNYEPETRLYRDPTTGRNRYLYNVSYKEWRETIGV